MARVGPTRGVGWWWWDGWQASLGGAGPRLPARALVWGRGRGAADRLPVLAVQYSPAASPLAPPPPPSIQIARTGALQLSPKYGLLCTLLRAAETAAAMRMAWRRGGGLPGYRTDAAGDHARGGYAVLLLVATSAAGLWAAALGDYFLRRRFITRERGGGGGGGGAQREHGQRGGARRGPLGAGRPRRRAFSSPQLVAEQAPRA
jgi:hypothetical protein